MFHFVSPVYLVAILLIPLFLTLLWGAENRESQSLGEFIAPEGHGKIPVRVRTNIRKRQGHLLIVAVVLIILALAEPRWGPPRALSSSKWNPGSLVIVVDSSKSMRAMDGGGVSRYEAATRVLNQLFKRTQGWRLGLVAFAGEAEVFCPLTTDHQAIGTLLSRARPGGVAGVGSNVEEGLRAAIPLFREKGHHQMLLVSDGEGHSGDPYAAVSELKKKGITLHVLICGDEQGSPVPAEPDIWGNPTFLAHQGEQVISRANHDVLLGLAQATSGEGVTVDGLRAAEQLAQALDLGRASPPPSATSSPSSRVPFEPFQALLLLAFACLLCEGALSLSGRKASTYVFQEILQQTLSRAGVISLLGLLSLGLSGWTWKPGWLLNQNAIEAMAQSDSQRAEAIWRAALVSDPQQAALNYNLGCALYARGAYGEALEMFDRALRNAGPETASAIRYNLGNVCVRMAERSGDKRHYESALKHYTAVLAAQPNDEDAQHNLEVVRRRLKQLSAFPEGNSASRPRSVPASNANTRPVGVQTQYRPPPPSKLPTMDEVDATLHALENDERRRQAELAPQKPIQQPDIPNPTRMIEQALRGMDEDKDW